MIHFHRRNRVRFLAACGCWCLLVSASGPTQAAEATLAAGSSPSAAALNHLQAGDVEQALTSLIAIADADGAWPSNDGALPAAAGGLYRALMNRAPDERYDLLHAWSFPDEPASGVRMLTSLTPQVAPPNVFARALGERPRDSTFAVAEVGPVRGLMSTAWLLVRSADEVGRLRQLTGELELLAARQVPRSEAMLLMARLADRRGDRTAVIQFMDARVARLRGPMDAANGAQHRLEPTDLVLAAAALGDTSLRTSAERLLEHLSQQALASSNQKLLPLIRLAHATAVHANRGVSDLSTVHEHQLRHWASCSGTTSELAACGAVDAVWLTHDDHVLHLAGGGNDALILRYPLTGDFQFHCETQHGGTEGTDGGLIYGGLQFEALGSTRALVVRDADAVHAVAKACPFVWPEERAAFSGVSILARPGSTVFATNQHPMWLDGDAVSQSPWLGLRSFGQRRPLFRNITITGNPVIPREVRLSDGDSLRGWQTGFYCQTQPNSIVSSATTDSSSDWRLSDGVLHAATSTAAPEATVQSRLHYQRPLLEDEAVQYEFYHASGVALVHPAIGRLAMLIEPDGVRIHWLTDGKSDWTGLPEDNALVEPLNRRGPRPVPLVEEDWNRVKVARAGGKVQLSLNDVVIYQRPIDFVSDHAFGFYRDRTMAAARIRHVVMTGNWPTSLPKNLLEIREAEASESQHARRHALEDLLGSHALSENVRAVRRRAAELTPAKRVEYLLDWMLPGPSAEPYAIRMACEFTPTQPAPSPIGETGVPASQEGAELVSPVLDLLSAAQQAGALEQVRQRIESIAEPVEEYDRRARAAMLIMLDLRQNKRESAVQRLDKFYSLVVESQPSELADVWPETLVVHQGVRGEGGSRLVGDLIGWMFQHRTMRGIPSGADAWHTHIAALMSLHQHLATGHSSESFDAPAPLRDWVPVVRSRARSRGRGHALARWQANEHGEVSHLSGHQEEYLFYRSPLRGNFDITCEIMAYGTTQAMAAGTFFGPVTDLALLERGSFRAGAGKRQPVAPPFSKFDRWVRFRAAFRDNICSVFLNGREIHRETLPPHYDPWFAVRSWWRNSSRFRDVRISGNPEVPETVILSASPQLVGWLAYHEDAVGQDQFGWRQLADAEHNGVIIGHHYAALTGSFRESLLAYQRPLVEDGSIEYEFFYEPNSCEVHPALDRLALLLKPEGVRLHWVTDSPFDRSGLPPNNIVDEPQHRRGPATLPLKPSGWNRLRLAMVGAVLSLELNGQLVFERPIEQSNQRTFGLFYYTSETEARVRNVVLRGEWPRTVPAVENQELADPVIVALDAELPRLDSVFTHDFAKDGLPTRFFQFRDSRGGSQLLQRPDGLQVVRAAPGAWASAEIAAQFVARGDFDLEAEFDQFEFAGDKDASILLVARLADEQLHHCRSIRTRHNTQRQLFQGSLSGADRDGKRAYVTKQLAWESTSGRLRVARRGNELYYLFADGDSQNYQLCGKDVVSAADTLPGGIDLSCNVTGTATVSVVWKRLRIAAEELLVLPDASTAVDRLLFGMNADGTELKQITQEVKGMRSHGSPDWSPDGKRIAFDANGSDGTHIFVANADGTNVKDLGLGYMPTYSPDGRRLAFTWSGQGIAIMNADGTNRQVIANEGWGAQWSPDGKWIAYETRELVNNQLAANITIIDVATKRKRRLLEGNHAVRYRQIFWNMEWSPDSRQICFKGTLSTPEGAPTEASITGIAGSSRDFKVLTTTNVQADFSWHPDGSAILMAISSGQHSGNKLYLCDARTGKLEILATQPMNHDSVSGVWSPDGRRIVFSSKPQPQPTPWRSGTEKAGLQAEQ